MQRVQRLYSNQSAYKRSCCKAGLARANSTGIHHMQHLECTVTAVHPEAYESLVLHTP
jgi:hypothetical protein